MLPGLVTFNQCRAAEHNTLFVKNNYAINKRVCIYYCIHMYVRMCVSVKTEETKGAVGGLFMCFIAHNERMYIPYMVTFKIHIIA